MNLNNKDIFLDEVKRSQDEYILECLIKIELHEEIDERFLNEEEKEEMEMV